jgi:coatomer subunit beta
MDYIRPATCSNDDFRSMWIEFEWENKVAINTNINELREFLDHIISHTNMTCLTTLGDNDTNVIININIVYNLIYFYIFL